MELNFFSQHQKSIIQSLHSISFQSYRFSHDLKLKGDQIIFKFEKQNKQCEQYVCKKCSYTCDSVKKLAGHAKKHRKDNNKNNSGKGNGEGEVWRRNESSGLFSFEEGVMESQEGEIFEEENSEEEHFKCLN